MKQYTLRWPDKFDEYSWEIESKGWFTGLEIEVDGKTLKPIFYDPVRLAQDMNEDIAAYGFFSEPRLIVVSELTPESIKRVVEELARNGGLERLF